jgi:hypothetical protein
VTRRIRLAGELTSAVRGALQGLAEARLFTTPTAREQGRKTWAGVIRGLDTAAAAAGLVRVQRGDVVAEYVTRDEATSEEIALWEEIHVAA